MEDTRKEVVDLTSAEDSRSRDPQEQSTVQLIRSIATDTSTLVRKEIELGKQELQEAIKARVKAAAALAVAGVMGLFVLGFLGAALAQALDNAMAPWLSRLIVAAAYALIAVMGVVFGLRKVKRPSLAPEETKRTVKEDVEWAKTQLKR